ncbi:MAG: D-aminoacyl-tRNA deacylase [Methanomassiliicoccaceae archaeon]|jgi:D-aminoacyl-tRNA deacylase|nr:D-aminoacyl-tRNA deacylase [Methanomassiliicoccaceae archaeon]
MPRKLLICSEEDIASVNIRDALVAKGEWEDDGTALYNDDMVMISIPDIHIRAENVDDTAKEKGIRADEIIFLSRHKAASGIPTLTVHPIGNFHSAELGGRPRALVKASPATMTGLLRSLASVDTGQYKVSFEVTHHGPWVNMPATFIEIGSDTAQWNDKEAATMIADSICAHEKSDGITAIGIGGGHYAPRFTEVARDHEINFGHMIPEYAFRDSDDDDLIRILRESAENSGTKLIYVHKKSMKGEMLKRVRGAIDACGMEAISSSGPKGVTES